MRVNVWNGDQSKFLGKGTLLGNVAVHNYIMIEQGRPILYTNQNPELPMLNPPQGAKHTQGKTPKIKLDSGGFAYGCQTWWREIPEEIKSEEPSLAMLTGIAEAAFDKYNCN